MILLGEYFQGGIEKLILMDMSEDMIQLCKKHEQDDQIETVYVVGDEENLPMEERLVQMDCLTSEYCWECSI